MDPLCPQPPHLCDRCWDDLSSASTFLANDVRLLTANGDDLAASDDPSRKMMRKIGLGQLDKSHYGGNIGQRRLMEWAKMPQIKRAAITPKIPTATANVSRFSSPLSGTLTPLPYLAYA
jgi:hypothetical protein